MSRLVKEETNLAVKLALPPDRLLLLDRYVLLPLHHPHLSICTVYVLVFVCKIEC